MTAASNPAAELTEDNSCERHAFTWTWPIEGGRGSIGVCELCGRITTGERDAFIAEAARLAAGGAAADEGLRARVEALRATMPHALDCGIPCNCWKRWLYDALAAPAPTVNAGERAAEAWIWTPRDGAYPLGLMREGLGWVSEDNVCRGAESNPDHIYFLAPAPTVGRADDTAAVVERAEHVVKAEALREFAAAICDRNALSGLSESARHFGRIYGSLARKRAAALAGAPSAPAEDQGGA